MVGKQLSALLQILRSQGVTRYQTNALTLELGPAPAKQAPVAIDLTPGKGDDDEEMGDPRFLLETLGKRHFPGRKYPNDKAKQ